MSRAGGCGQKAQCVLLQCHKQMLYQGPRVLQLSEDRFLCAWHFDSYYEYLLFAETFQTGILQMKLLQLIVIENSLRFYLLKSVFST